MYSSFADAYQATMRGTDANGQPMPLVNSTGAKYLDQACGSQAQANWRTQADKDANVSRPPWVAGEMTGYASSVAGYPSNLQPALAAAADADVPGRAGRVEDVREPLGQTGLRHRAPVGDRAPALTAAHSTPAGKISFGAWNFSGQDTQGTSVEPNAEVTTVQPAPSSRKRALTLPSKTPSSRSSR